ncbi:hexokinase-1 [Echria macrotheca]|uniref:Phosphotransferase n=1 Tax=Echria macrotheca TaxID=438768 RepID=A0AAJ0F6H6_9PEZI|nr:hexokinase-1 [Echria macrotheca]
MRPLISAMTSLRHVLLAALKSLLRGKSFLQAMLAFWISPAAVTSQDGKLTPGPTRTVADFLNEAEDLLLGPVDDGLSDFAAKLKQQFRIGLRSNPACMLPSYNHQLPSGHERGQYLALDVGGSTFRVALVELRGKGVKGPASTIVQMDSFRIDSRAKSLRGLEFFDWMAERILQTISKESKRGSSPDDPLLVGMAWSFPIEQTSSKGGKLCGMGKGFYAAEGLIGRDLGEIIELACRKRNLYVELSAIVNDSSATLLSEAYLTSSTRFGLILGTGVNIAVHLPVGTIGQPKYGDRPQSWHDKASHVIVNTELGMFGKGILPLTKWDYSLLDSHPRPDFQPLEHLVSGYYVGEVCRLALVEAIETTGLFGGIVPPSLLSPYSLDTETLSLIAADTDPSSSAACKIFASRHPSVVEPDCADIAVLRTISSYIARRSASIVAASLVALWELKSETEEELLNTLPADSPFAAETKAEMEIARTTVAFNGSVIEHYPGYLQCAQQYIDDLVSTSSRVGGSIELVAARESSLLGAAVALACLE